MKVISLLALFFIIGFAKTEQLEFLEPNGLPIMEKISGLSNGILCIMNGIQSVLQAFKSSKSTIIKRIIEKQGFDSFVGKTTIFMSKGVAASRLDTYKSVFKTLSKIPSEYTDIVNNFIEGIEYVDGDAWNSFDFLFDNKVPTDDSTTYATCLGTHNQGPDTYDFFTISNKINFKLAPNIMIMEDSLSVAGGIYSHQKERIVYLPREITKEDIKLIMTFFQGVSFKALGKLFGMKLPNFN